MTVTNNEIGAFINALPTDSTPDGAADKVLVWDNSATEVKGVLLDNLPGAAAAIAAKYIASGRLTLETGVPVSTTDQTAKTILYYTPYNGDQISLYNGATWDIIDFTELSIAVPATTAQMYDVFCYNNSGTATLELTAWTNDTTRATALIRQNGILCKTGALTRRYLGSMRTTAVSGQTEDSETKHFVWNYYNRVTKRGVIYNSNATTTYTTAAWRESNNGSGQVRCEFIIGVAEDCIEYLLKGQASTDNTAQSYLGLGMDKTNGSETTVTITSSAGVKYFSPLNAVIPAIGYHYMTTVEYCGGGTMSTYWSTTDNVKMDMIILRQ